VDSKHKAILQKMPESPVREGGELHQKSSNIQDWAQSAPFGEPKGFSAFQLDWLILAIPKKK